MMHTTTANTTTIHTLFLFQTHPQNNTSTQKPNTKLSFQSQPNRSSHHKPTTGTKTFSLCYKPHTTTTKTSQEEEKQNGFSKWVEIRPHNMTEQQKHAVSSVSPDLSKRCKALVRQIICFDSLRQQWGKRSGSEVEFGLSDLLGAWVRVMKPRRTDWLSVLKELKVLEHPLFVKVAELMLLEESFEANVRDYTKLIHFYGKQNQIKEAETTLLALKRRGFVCDQVTLTTMIHMYSKAGNLSFAEQTFEKLKLLGELVDHRSYGSMIMAYIRAGMPEEGEKLIREMDAQEIRAGSEVYKALLRHYSMAGNSEGAQRVFDAIQIAGIPPDVRVCGLLINAYCLAGQSGKARIAFNNMRRAGLEPRDKCVALLLAAYEKENNLNDALELLVDLERDGVMIGKEASETLAGWFRKLGVAKEVELVLRERAMDVGCKTLAC